MGVVSCAHEIDDHIGRAYDFVVSSSTSVREAHWLAEVMPDFIQARHYTPANRATIRLICVHAMQSAEKPWIARAVAKWFAGPVAPRASAHACVDDQEIVLCVHEKDIAWGAPGANRDGYHIEHSGRVGQNAAEWADSYSQAVLERSAKHAAQIANKYSIPIRRLTVAEVADGQTPGFCGHIDVTRAFRKSTHTDPGPNFPWDHYLELVEDAMQHDDSPNT